MTLNELKLTPEQLQAIDDLAVTDGLRSAGRLFVHVALYFAAAAWTAYWVPHVLPTFLGIVAFAFIAAAFLGPFHECVHYTAFKSRRACDVVGVACGTLGFGMFQLYRYVHYEHHRHTQEPGDPDDALFARLGKIFAFPWASWVRFCRYPEVEKMPFIPQSKHSLIVWECRGQVATYVVVIATLAITAPALLLCFLAGWWLSVIVRLTHTRCEHRGLPRTGTLCERTRSFKTNALWRYLMWNENYHTEHHLFPRVPWFNLPKVHRMLPREPLQLRSGYLSTLRDSLAARHASGPLSSARRSSMRP